MTFSNRQKIFLVLGSALMVFLILFLLVIYPLVNRIKAASQKYLSNEEILSRLARRESSLRNLQEGYQELEPDFLKIKDVFLSREQAIGFISTLENIAEKTGNDFELKLVGPASRPAQAEPLPQVESSLGFQVTVKGDFYGLLKFLASLENTPYQPYRLIKLDSLSIRNEVVGSSPQTAQPGNLKSVLNLRIFTQ